jgi:hypothetical protein
VGYKTGDYLWFMSGRGVSELSLKVFMLRQKLHKLRHEWISPKELESLTDEDDFLRSMEEHSNRTMTDEMEEVQQSTTEE